MAHPLFVPPKLRLPSSNRDRHASWLELFYDLVFAVAVAALENRLANRVSLIDVWHVIVLFLPTWWAWVGHTVYDTRFDNDDLFHRLSTLGMMMAAATMAVAIPFAFEGQAKLFTIAYICARLSLLALYLRSYLYIAEARAIIRLYMIGFGLGVSLWVLAIFLDTPLSYICWLSGLAIDFITPWLGQHILRRAPLDTTHIPERFASFTIIVLGELIAVIVSRVTGIRIQPVSYLFAFLAFCITCCIWWLYFTFMENASIEEKLGPGQPFIYVHLPLVFGLILLGGAFELMIDATGALHFSDGTRWLLGGGLIMWSLAGLVLKLVMTHLKVGYWVFVRVTLLVSCVLLLCIGDFLPPLLLLTVFSCLLLLFTMFEVRHLNAIAPTSPAP